MTASAVSDAFETLFSDTTLQGLTPNAYGFPATEASEFEVQGFYYQGAINFWQYLVTAGQDFKVASSQDLLQKHYTVEITYYREQDTSGENWQAVRDAFETLYSRMVAVLGAKWSDTVDFWRSDAEPPVIEAATLDSRPVWRGVYKFTAEQQISI